MILQMHTPARSSQCWSRQTRHGLGVCIWMHLVNGTGDSPSPGQPTPGVVQQDKSSGGSVDTTKTRSGPQSVRMSSGERPIGAAKGKQPDTLCPPPPPRRLRFFSHYPPPPPHPASLFRHLCHLWRLFVCTISVTMMIPILPPVPPIPPRFPLFLPVSPHYPPFPPFPPVCK